MQTVEAAEDVALRADNSHRAASLAERLIEHITLFSVELHALHTFLAACHGMTQVGQFRVGMFKRLCENALTGDFFRVGMHEICSSTSYHDAVGVGIWLGGRDGLREPGDGEADVDYAHFIAMLVVDGLAIAGNHLSGVGSRVEIHVRLSPARFVEQDWHQIPISVEILVVVAAALYSAYRVADMLGIGGEVLSLLLEVIRLEGDGGIIEVRIVEQNAATVNEHRFGIVEMALNQPFVQVGGYFHTVHDTLDLKRSVVEDTSGFADSLLTHGITRFVEEESEGDGKYDGCKKHHPNTDSH